MKRAIGIFVFFGVLSGISAAADSEATDPGGARQVFRLLNEFRAQNGKAALQWDERLAQAALEHAYLCAKNKELSHQYSGEPVLRLRIAKFNVLLDRVGENLSMDSTVEGAHEGLTHSPPHRANMLSADYNAVGIAVVTANGHYYVVEDFAHLMPELSASQVEEKLAAEFDALRAKAGTPVLSHSSSSDLRVSACRMAASDDLKAKNASGTGARYIVAFTMADPKNLPDELKRLRSDRNLGSYGIGACLARSQTYPNGVYWVVMAFYEGGGKASR